MISGIRQEEFVPVAILFSGGLDSMILAALLDKCLDPNCEYLISFLFGLEMYKVGELVELTCSNLGTFS